MRSRLCVAALSITAVFAAAAPRAIAPATARTPRQHDVRPPVERIADATTGRPDALAKDAAWSLAPDTRASLVRADLHLYAWRVTSAIDGLFSFRLFNFGPDACRPGTYEIRVFVDGFEDSSALNQSTLGVFQLAIWEWQLAYIYPAGLHTITVTAYPIGSDPYTLDNVMSFSMLVQGPAVKMTLPGGDTGVVNEAYSRLCEAIDGTPPYRWSVSSGWLPPGVFLSTDGTLAGVPAATGAFKVSLNVTDSAGSYAYGQMTITVFNTNDLAGPVIADRVLPVGFVDATFNAHLSAVGGQAPYAWALVTSLPDGLGLAADGAVSGSPLNAGWYATSVTVQDSLAALADTEIITTIRWADQFVNPFVKKLNIGINWKRRDAGALDSDTISLHLRFPVPDFFVVDHYTYGTVSIGNYTVPMNFTKKASWRRYAKFKYPKKDLPTGTANVRWKRNNEIRVSVNLSKARIVEELERLGLERATESTFLLPFRAVVNENDTGGMMLNVRYTPVGLSRGKVKLDQ